MPNLPNVFETLKTIMKTVEKQLVLKCDEPGRYYLDTHRVRADGYVFAFGGVEIEKNYVSYHLMPVYTHPELLEDVSATLKKRMQGKSCFNFTKIDADVLKELEALTVRGRAALTEADFASGADSLSYEKEPF